MAFNVVLLLPQWRCSCVDVVAVVLFSSMGLLSDHSFFHAFVRLFVRLFSLGVFFWGGVS